MSRKRSLPAICLGWTEAFAVVVSSVLKHGKAKYNKLCGQSRVLGGEYRLPLFEEMGLTLAVHTLDQPRRQMAARPVFCGSRRGQDFDGFATAFRHEDTQALEI